MKDALAIEFNENHVKNMHSYLEQKLVAMKAIAEPQSGSRANVGIKVPLPPKIGDSDYIIRGDAHDLVIDIPGRGSAQGRQTIFRSNIYWWDTANFTGAAFSGTRQIEFFYNKTTRNITIS